MLEYLLLNRSWAHWQISDLVRCAPFTKSACDRESKQRECSFKRDLNADAPKLNTILACLKEWTRKSRERNMLREQAPMVRNSAGARLKTAESRTFWPIKKLRLDAFFLSPKRGHVRGKGDMLSVFTMAHTVVRSSNFPNSQLSKLFYEVVLYWKFFLERCFVSWTTDMLLNYIATNWTHCTSISHSIVLIPVKKRWLSLMSLANRAGPSIKSYILSTSESW